MDYINKLIKDYRTTFLFIVIFLLTIIGLLIIDFIMVSNVDSFKENILVEAHGVLGDIFIFGIIISVYDTIRINSERKEDRESQKQLQIDRYNEELDDFRHWNDEEAMYRNVGNIKRLVSNGKQSLNLTYCNLSNSKLINFELKKASFIDANLENSKFTTMKFIDCEFIGANLKNAIFSSLNMNTYGVNEHRSIVHDCRFQNTNLEGASFIGVELSKVRLIGAKLNMLFVTDENWIDGLETSSREYVEENYALLDHNLYTSIIRERDHDVHWKNTFFLFEKENFDDVSEYKFLNNRENPY